MPRYHSGRFSVRNLTVPAGWSNAQAAGQELPAVSCKRAALLDIPADACERWCEAITQGFTSAARFRNRCKLSCASVYIAST